MSHSIQASHSDSYAFARDRTYTQKWARQVLPAVFELTGKPGRVLDLGGAQGHWCKVCMELGVSKVCCVDHPAMAESVVIPREEFVPFRLDVGMPDPIESDFAMSIEFAEHVPLKRAPEIVHFLCQSAPFVLFSAAQPFQSGVGHINGRWPDYWNKLFLANGYSRLDVVRPLIISNPILPWWLKQNLFLFVRHDTADAIAKVAKYQRLLPDEFVVIHHEALPGSRGEPKTVRDALLHLRLAIGNSLRSRLARFRSRH